MRHYTYLRFLAHAPSLARVLWCNYAQPTLSSVFLALRPKIGPRRGADACRPTAATPARMTGGRLPPLVPRQQTAPFLRGFSEPPGEATGWESTPGYLRSCKSRFSSVSSGDSASSPGSPGEKMVPFCATWNDPSSRILPRDVSVPACATWARTSSRPSFPSSSSHPLTHPEDDSYVGGIDSPRDMRRALRPV
jgi:hypothetical protein